MIVAIVLCGIMGVVGYMIGNRGKDGYMQTITTLTAERDVQKANAENATKQLDTQKEEYERNMQNLKAGHDKNIQALR